MQGRARCCSQQKTIICSIATFLQYPMNLLQRFLFAYPSQISKSLKNLALKWRNPVATNFAHNEILSALYLFLERVPTPLLSEKSLISLAYQISFSIRTRIWILDVTAKLNMEFQVLSIKIAVLIKKSKEYLLVENDKYLSQNTLNIKISILYKKNYQVILP